MKRTMSLMQEYKYLFSSILGLKKKVEKLEEGGGDFIPLTGTEEGKLVTGDIGFDVSTGFNFKGDRSEPISINRSGDSLRIGNSNIGFRFNVSSDQVSMGVDRSDAPYFTFEDSDKVIFRAAPSSMGIEGYHYYGGNYTDNAYVQKKYVDDLIVPPQTPSLQSILDESGIANDRTIQLVEAGQKAFLAPHVIGILGNNGDSTVVAVNSISFFNATGSSTYLDFSRTLGGQAKYIFDNTKPQGEYTLATLSDIEDTNSYSTTEIKTGGTWINNKPVYSKTFTLVGDGTSSVITDISSLNIDSFISIDGVHKDNNSGDIFPLNGGDSSLNVKINGTSLIYRNGFIGSNVQPAHVTIVTIKYTKTTD